MFTRNFTSYQVFFCKCPQCQNMFSNLDPLWLEFELALAALWFWSSHIAVCVPEYENILRYGVQVQKLKTRSRFHEGIMFSLWIIIYKNIVSFEDSFFSKMNCTEILSTQNLRYFIVKSCNRENLELSVQQGVWATQRSNEAKLNEAFDSVENVILIFSVNRTRHFQVYF